MESITPDFSLCIFLIRIYFLGLGWAEPWFLSSLSTALSGMILHIWWEGQWGGLKYMDCTMSIRGKFRKTNPKCLRAIYSPKQKNFKPHKTIKPQPNQAHPPKGLLYIVIKNAFMFLKQNDFKLAPFKNKLYSPDIPI